MPEVWSIVVAGGRGERFGRAKQFETLGDRRVLDWAVAAATAASDGVVVVLPADSVGTHAPGSEDLVVTGGASRSESVRQGLAVVPTVADVVCVHDAARPFATTDLFAAVIAAVRAGVDGAVPALAVTDTIKVVGTDGVVVTTLDRSTLVAVQTPQAFRASVLRDAHARMEDGTDDASLVEAAGGRVVAVPGEPLNRKVTQPADLDWARQQVAAGVAR